MELIFVISIIIRFLTDFIPQGDIRPVKELGKISDKYLKESFWREFIPTIPVTFIFEVHHDSFWRILFLIKIIRLYNCYNAFSIADAMKMIKRFIQN